MAADAVHVGKDLLTGTFEQLRACGRGWSECIVYWTGALERPGEVDGLEHPRHTLGLAGYEIDPAWLNEFFLGLRRDRRAVRIQVHTHPRLAFHSPIDDRYPLVPIEGFLSLVIPNLAEGPVSLEDTYLARLTAKMKWRSLDPGAFLLL